MYKLDKELNNVETVQDHALLERYITERGIDKLFSTCSPRLMLFHYSPGDLLTSPFTPSQYLQFIVKGDLLLYDMANEVSTVTLETNFHELKMLGEMELLDAAFTPFFVEARTDVYTVALHIAPYQQALLNDPAFLRYMCVELAEKLNGAVKASTPPSLSERVRLSVSRLESGKTVSDIGTLAKYLNVSTRQLLRVLKELCEEGILVHEKKGVYRVV